MTLKFNNFVNTRMVEVNKLLEKSKDFHLQHLVNICESTKAIIQTITNFSNDQNKSESNVKGKNTQGVLEITMREVLVLQKHLMRFTID